MKKKIRAIIAIVVLSMLIICNCNSDKKQQYYSEKGNYISVKGTVTHIKYNDDNSALYLGFSDLQPACDDNTFKICGDNLLKVQAKGIDEKIAIGTNVEFITAPRYFGDGYVMPIVSVSVDGEVLLEFEEGYSNFMKWLESN